MHPNHPDSPPRTDAPPPYNLEAEQAVLGILLFDAHSILEIEGAITGADFFEPYHSRLFTLIEAELKAGRLASPALLANHLLIDPAFEHFGGTRYLLDLLDRAPPTAQARHFAQAIRSLALRREVIRMARSMEHKAQTETDVDGATLLSDFERDLLAVQSRKDDLTLTSYGQAAREVLYGLENPQNRKMISLGLSRIDKLLGGAEPGDLLVLGGRPGMGKSALAAVVARKIAESGYGVAELNGEMTVQQMTRRHLTDLAFERHGYDAPFYRMIREGRITPEQHKILAQVAMATERLPLFMIKRTGMTLGRIRAMLMRQKMVWERQGIPMGAVVIDHVGLVAPDSAGRSRNEDQTIVSGRLKALADELGVVMIALAQLNRQVESREDKRPGLADLRDSGSWEQDADVVIGVYRDAYYARREQEPKNQLKVSEWMARCSDPTIEAIGLKVREGDVGTARLWASIGHNAIQDDAPDGDLSRSFDFKPQSPTSLPQETLI